jgi:hypothetical protein
MTLDSVETAFDRTHDLDPHSQNVVQVEVKSLRLKMRPGQRARLTLNTTLRVRTGDDERSFNYGRTGAERNIDDLLNSPEGAIATELSRMAATLAAHVVSAANA